MSEPAPTVFLITGRSLLDFRMKSEEPPSGSVFLPCGECKKTVAISAEGAAKLEEARARGAIAVAICTSCAITLAARPRGIDGVWTTQEGRKAIATNADAQLLNKFFRSRVRKS